MKKLKWNMIFMSVAYLVLGAVLLCWPRAVLDAICYVIGGLVMLSGVLQLIRFFSAREELFFAPATLTLGLVCLGLGLFLIVRSDIVQTVLPIVFGLFVLFDSVLRVQNAMQLRHCGYGSWLAFLGLALLSVVLGLVMIYNPFGAISTLVVAIGVILIIEGALNLLGTLYTVVAVRRFVKHNPVAAAVADALVDADDAPDLDAALEGDAVLEGTAVEVDDADL